MKLARFVTGAELFSASEIEKVRLLAYFHLKKSELAEFSTKDVASWFDELGLAAPNQTRLRKNIGKSKTFIRGSLPRTHRLQAAEIAALSLKPAAEDDFGKEFLSLVAAVSIVDSLDEAMEHIYRFGTGHSDAIITEDYSAAMRFLDEVDSAVVYVNASTQFTDGAQFGLGAEIIDSTQKTIARGPVGLREITTYKWIVLGSGQTRPL